MAQKPQRRPGSALRRVVLPSPGRAEGVFLARALRQETVGGMLLLIAAVIAVGWANSPWQDVYFDLRHAHLGPLTLEEWAADGLLTVFFFVVGVELKRELVVGSLSRPADAMVPVVAAAAGMAMPALLYIAINIPGGDLRGWAIPTATDIAFALAVLAVVGTHLPTALRAFLLTLAVVDDLGAILIIAVAFTSGLNFAALGISAGLCALYFVLQHFRIRASLLYLPLAVATWWFVHESGIHATIAGVALGMLTRVRPDDDEHASPAERLEHRLRPLSAGLAVPIFALASAGVALTGGLDSFTQPVSLGIMIGLVLGKAIGVTAGAFLTTKVTRAHLNPSLDWGDIFPVGVLAGIGFTVSLLITELAFGDETTEVAKAAVLAGSVVAALLSAVLLRLRNRRYRKVAEAEATAQ